MGYVRKLYSYLLNKDVYLILSILIGFSVLYSFISLQKHNHFQTFAWDTAFFDQQIYFINQFQAPYTSLGKMNGLGDHFHILFLILGFLGYKIWNNVSVLFIIQSFIACFSALPLYFLTKEVLRKTKLSLVQIKILSMLVSVSYLGSVAFQGMVLDEFHNDPLATLPLLSLLYFLIKKNSLGYYISLLFLLLAKETYGLFCIPLGIYIYLKNKDLKKGLITALIGLSVFLLLVYVVMPRMANLEEYFHFNDTNRPSSVILKLLVTPSLIVTKFIDEPDKINTLIHSVYAYGFLPMFSIVDLVMPLFSLGIRFYDESSPLLYKFNNHYSVPLMSFLAVAMSYGVANLINLLSKKGISNEIIFNSLAVYLIVIIITQDLIWHGPVNSVFKKSFYESQSWEIDTKELLKKVPDNEVIASQNSLLPHLSQREKFYLLPEIGDAEYIAVDLSDGPNKFSPSNQREIFLLVDKLINQKQYKVIWKQNDSMLLKKTTD